MATEIIRKHFSLVAWHDYRRDAWGEFHLARFRVDWLLLSADYGQPWFALDVGVLGLNASLTFWPEGKQ